MHATQIPHPIGTFVAHFSQRGLARLEFPPGETARKKNQTQREPTSALPPEIRRWHRLTEQALNLILAANSPTVMPPLDISSGSDFQQAVWKAMLRIPLGATKSYADIARDIRKPKATRAVGNACGANPIPVLIPCHRVVASGGGLGGFSGDIHWKKSQLLNEGVLIDGSDLFVGDNKQQRAAKGQGGL